MPPPTEPVHVTGEKPPARPAMPSGTVRARRMHPRYRKAKARPDAGLEPAAPTSAEIKATNEAKSRANKNPKQVQLVPSSQPSQSSAPLAQQIVQQLSPLPQNRPRVTSHLQQPPPQVEQLPQSVSYDTAAQLKQVKLRAPSTSSPTSLPTSASLSTSTSFPVPAALPISASLPVSAPAVTASHSASTPMVAPHSVQLAPPSQPTRHSTHHASSHESHQSVQQVTHTAQQPNAHNSVPRSASRSATQLAVRLPSIQTPPAQTLVRPRSVHAVSHSAKVLEAPPGEQVLQPLQNKSFDGESGHGGSPRLIVDLSPESQKSSASEHVSVDSVDEGVQPSAVSQLVAEVKSPDYEKSVEEDEMSDIAKLVDKIKVSSDAPRARPLICQDITNSNADTLRISRLPRGVTYDRLVSMVEPFGEIEDLVWTATDPYVCDVTYRDPAAAREAKHFLGDALVGSDTEPSLKAELRSRDPGAQLFVGDLTPDVTEEMLEAKFSELVGEPVSALLKRDPDSFSPIGYGFLSFKSESSANFALVAGHRIKIGNACVRVGRAERNTYLYVSDLAPNVSLEELKNVFGKFGNLVEEDTVIIRRSYAFIRFRNRGAAEKAKRTLDKTDLKGRLSVRYAEAEPMKACVAVQFHSSVPRPPNSLRDLLSATFSKHGNCTVEIPRLQNGMWRKVAFVTFHGEPISANLAALEAVQSIRFVSSLPVCCQFARELIPRLPSRGLRYEASEASDQLGANMSPFAERVTPRPFLPRRGNVHGLDGSDAAGSQGRAAQHGFAQSGRPYGSEGGVQQGSDFVPIYVPITALQTPGQVTNQVQASEGDLAGYQQQQWQPGVMMPNNGAMPQDFNPAAAHFTPNCNNFPPLERPARW